MAAETNIFTLRFFDEDKTISPESFSAKELGQLIISFYEGLKTLIDVRYPDINSEQLQLSLVTIENQSQSLTWAASGYKEVAEALHDLGNAVTKNTYTDLPTPTYKAVRSIYGITKKKKCSAELVEKGKRLFVVSKDDQLIKQVNVLVKSDMVLYGILNKIGGDKNRAWVELYDDSRISFPISDEQLVVLRSKVKEAIAVQGTATWNTISKRVVYFKIKSVIDYTAGAVSEGFEEIRKLSSGWDSDQTNNNKGITDHLNGEA